MNALNTVITILYLFFNLALPKAGTKIGYLPLYVSLIITLCVVFPVILHNFIKYFRAKQERVLAVYLFSFIFVWIIDFTVYPKPANFNYIITDQLPFFFGIISAFFFLFPKYIPVKLKLFRNIILVCFFLVTIYGFIQKIFGDIRTLIPGITYNYAETIRFKDNNSPNIWAKHNYIESNGWLKLASTYQNGNLFGVNYLMMAWFALYFLSLNKKILSRILFYLSFAAFLAICIMTASSTVYIGLLFSLLLYYIYLIIQIYKSDEKRKALKIFFFISIPVILVIGLFIIMNSSRNMQILLNQKLLQRNFLGDNRVTIFYSYCRYLWENKLIYKFLFGSYFITPSGMGAYEIVPANIFVNFGILFTGVFVFFIWYIMKNLKFTIYNIGLFTYILASFMDGGFWLPPTPFNFFSLIGFSYFVLSKKDGKSE